MRNSALGHRPRQGFTILELLVAIGIIALLIALVLPAILNTRGSARRLNCSANLKQIGIAVGAYESTHGVLPSGNNPMGFSTHVVLLPFLDAKNLYSKFDSRQKVFYPPNNAVVEHGLSLFKCPDNPSTSAAFLQTQTDFTNYVGAAGGGPPHPVKQNGVLVNVLTERWLPPSAIVDGRSNTVMMSEAVAIPLRMGSPPSTAKGAFRRTTRRYYIPAQLPQLVEACRNGPYQANWGSLGQDWRQGSVGCTRYIHFLPPNSPSCYNEQSVVLGLYSPTSYHTGGVNVLTAGGAVRFVADSIDRHIWVASGTRAGREPVSDF